MYIKILAYMSKDGDSFSSVYPIGKDGVEFSQPIDWSNVHPSLSRIQNVKTLEEMRVFLRAVQADPQANAHIDFMHIHNAKYRGHNLTIFDSVFTGPIQKGVAHKDTLAKLIEFVEFRLAESNLLESPRQGCLIA